MDRNELLLNTKIVSQIKKKTVLVCGVGGVGGFAIESLARLGVGTLIIIDNDIIEESNKNRQIIALDSTIGKSKVAIMKERIQDINKDIKVIEIEDFFDKSKYSLLDSFNIDYVIDAIDTLKAKWDLINYCLNKQIPFISSMGMGNRNDPSKIKITTLDKTKGDPVAKKIRELARKNMINIKKIKVVFSEENPLKIENHTNKKLVSSCIFVPSVAGLYCGYSFLNWILEENK